MRHEGFTPGPWRWMQRGDFSVLERNEEPSRFPILKIANGGLLPMGPDARLIADAPDLLAENERLRALLIRACHELKPTIAGKFVSVDIRTALAATKDGSK